MRRRNLKRDRLDADIHFQALVSLLAKFSGQQREGITFRIDAKELQPETTFYNQVEKFCPTEVATFTELKFVGMREGTSPL